MTYNEDTYIETVSGIKFYFMDPKPEMIKIEDIYQSLSKQCRYTGHVHTFYSVAEHCCHLYDYAVEHLDVEWVVEDQYLRTILMHDASEAYLTDLARPIKQFLPQYKELESRIETALAEKYKLIYPYPGWVKEYDTRILLDERAQGMNPSENVWAVDNLEPLGIRLEFWKPERAAAEFFDRWMTCAPTTMDR